MAGRFAFSNDMHTGLSRSSTQQDRGQQKGALSTKKLRLLGRSICLQDNIQVGGLGKTPAALTPA